MFLFFYCFFLKVLHTQKWYDVYAEKTFPGQNCTAGLPLDREKSEKFKLKEKSGNFEKSLGNLGKSFESQPKLTRKVKRSHDATNWKCMCTAIQQKLKCNVDVEDPTLIV